MEQASESCGTYLGFSIYCCGHEKQFVKSIGGGDVTIGLILEHRPQKLRNVDRYRSTPFCSVPFSNKASAPIKSLWFHKRGASRPCTHARSPVATEAPFHAESPKRALRILSLSASIRFERFHPPSVPMRLSCIQDR